MKGRAIELGEASSAAKMVSEAMVTSEATPRAKTRRLEGLDAKSCACGASTHGEDVQENGQRKSRGACSGECGERDSAFRRAAQGSGQRERALC